MEALSALPFAGKWLLGVAVLTALGAVQGLARQETLRRHQFSGPGARRGMAGQHELSSLAGRLFAWWTMVSCTVRAVAAFHLDERGPYLTAVASFVLVLVFYGTEVFVTGTVPAGKAVAPFIVATSSLVVLLLDDRAVTHRLR